MSGSAAMSSQTDQDLMALVQADDAEAFAALYDRLVGKALIVVRAMHVERDRVEDVIQEAFLSVWRSRAIYQPERGQVRAWILSIVGNRALDSIRLHGRHDRARSDREQAVEEAPAPGDVEADALERDDALALRSLLAQLPPAQREVIALAYFGSLTHVEIARELALPLGTIKGRMRLGLEQLRRQIAA
jgi:RNA polymerase sigma-70 factor (ECF subfamily)